MTTNVGKKEEIYGLVLTTVVLHKNNECGGLFMLRYSTAKHETVIRR